MNDKQKEELKNKINSEIENLTRQVKELEDTVAPVKPDAAIGRLSRLDTMLNQGINKSSIAQSRQRILNLEDALNRLEKDVFFRGMRRVRRRYSYCPSAGFARKQVLCALCRAPG